MFVLKKISSQKSALTSAPLRFISYTPKAFVGTPAPEFKKTALMPDGSFGQVSLSQYKGKYVVLFFYPLDFTFVCPTEIIAFSDRAQEFRNIGCEVLAASIDSEFSHLAWSKQERKKGGLGKMDIPIIADVNKSLSKDYGVLIDEAQIALRGLFIIDEKGVLRQSTINDLPVGRNVDEVLRLVKAFQYTDKHGEVCPAGWNEKNSKTINTKKAEDYFASVNQ